MLFIINGFKPTTNIIITLDGNVSQLRWCVAHQMTSVKTCDLWLFTFIVCKHVVLCKCCYCSFAPQIVLFCL